MGMTALFLFSAVAVLPTAAPATPALRSVVVAQARAEIVRAERVTPEAERDGVLRTVRLTPKGAEIAFE
jgi:hypothetical protein